MDKNKLGAAADREFAEITGAVAAGMGFAGALIRLLCAMADDGPTPHELLLRRATMRFVQ